MVSSFAVSGVLCSSPAPQPWLGLQNTSRLYIAVSSRNTTPPTRRNRLVGRGCGFAVAARRERTEVRAGAVEAGESCVVGSGVSTPGTVPEAVGSGLGRCDGPVRRAPDPGSARHDRGDGQEGPERIPALGAPGPHRCDGPDGTARRPPARAAPTAPPPRKAPPTPVALTIAGSETTGGAGAQTDLKTFHQLGTFGTAALTCIVSFDPKNDWGHRFVPVDPQVTADQIEATTAMHEIDTAKIGMPGTPATIDTVAASLGERSFTNVVLDPVLICTGQEPGAALDTDNALKEKILP